MEIFDNPTNNGTLAMSETANIEANSRLARKSVHIACRAFLKACSGSRVSDIKSGLLALPWTLAF